MLKEKSVELIRVLNPLIKKYSNNDKVRKLIVDEFDRRNMKGSLGITILTEKRALSTLDIDERKDLVLLYVFTKAIYNALSFKENEDSEIVGEINDVLSIVPDNYFNPIEIEDLEQYKEEKKSNIKKQYVLHNMIRVAPNYYKGIISAKDLAEMDAENDIIYNFTNQRDPHIDVYGEKRIQFDKVKAERITFRLLEGSQFSDDIKLNLLHDGEDEIHFNEKNGDLTIISGNLNIFDGYHRKTASSNAVAKAKENNEELDFNWGLVITNFSEKKTLEFMTQINEQKPMKKEHIKNLDSSKLGNVVVDLIRDIESSEFGQNIKESDAELKFGGFTKKSLLAISIEECYEKKLTNRLKIKAIAKHIADVMDYIIALNIEDFMEHPEATSKASYINHKNMFAGYVALSERLYEVDKWEDIVEEILSKINFSIEDPKWKSIGFKKESEMKKPTRNNLYKLFQELI